MNWALLVWLMLITGVAFHVLVSLSVRKYLDDRITQVECLVLDMLTLQHEALEQLGQDNE